MDEFDDAAEIAVPTIVSDFPWWKDPEVRGWVHGAITFTGGLLIVLIPLVIQNLSGPQPLVELSATMLVLVTAVLNYAYSQLGNKQLIVVSKSDHAMAKVMRKETGRLPVAKIVTSESNHE